MSNSVVQLAPDGTGKSIDAEQVSVASLDVQRQRIQVAGAADVEIARVAASSPAASDHGLVTRPILAATQGGATPFKRISTADVNSANIKASAGQVYAIYATNVNAAIRYLKVYDKATAPTVGTDAPVFTLGIPGGTTGGVLKVTIPPGVVFATGIGMGLTTGIADADTGAVAASEIAVNIAYR